MLSRLFGSVELRWRARAGPTLRFVRSRSGSASALLSPLYTQSQAPPPSLAACKEPYAEKKGNAEQLLAGVKRTGKGERIFIEPCRVSHGDLEYSAHAAKGIKEAADSSLEQIEKQFLVSEDMHHQEDNRISAVEHAHQESQDVLPRRGERLSSKKEKQPPLTTRRRKRQHEHQTHMADLPSCVEALLSIGMDTQTIVNVLSTIFNSHCRTCPGTVQQHIGFLRSAYLDDKSICKFIKQAPWILLMEVEPHLKRRLELLSQTLAIPPPRVKLILLWRPEVFQLSEERVVQQFESVGEVGIERGSNVYFLLFLHILGRRVDVLKVRTENLYGCGFSKGQVFQMLRNYPPILGLKDKSVNEKVSYIAEVMKRPLTDIVKYPNVLGSSLERRIKPRYEAYMRWRLENNVDHSHTLQSLILHKDSLFKKHFVNIQYSDTRV